jgi:hypothetical protein
MEVKLYKFPFLTINNIGQIEKKLYELEAKYRQGDKLEDEELTWMDLANTWVLSISTNNHEYVK